VAQQAKAGPAAQRAIAEGQAEDGFGLDMVRTADADHGRNEGRHFILHDVSTLNRRQAWSGLGAVGMVEAEVERDGRITVTRCCFLCSRDGSSGWPRVAARPWSSATGATRTSTGIALDGVRGRGTGKLDETERLTSGLGRGCRKSA
jgi:hypothetical protein